MTIEERKNAVITKIKELKSSIANDESVESDEATIEDYQDALGEFGVEV